MAEEPEEVMHEEGVPAEEPEGVEAPPPNVYMMLQVIVGLLAEQAWQLMGIRVAPGQKEPVKDIAQAKIAIDTISFIADKLHPQLTEEERTAIRGLVSDLQLNFVRQG